MDVLPGDVRGIVPHGTLIIKSAHANPAIEENLRFLYHEVVHALAIELSGLGPLRVGERLGTSLGAERVEGLLKFTRPCAGRDSTNRVSMKPGAVQSIK